MSNQTLVNTLKYLVIDMCDARAARVVSALALDLNVRIEDFQFDLDDEQDVTKRITMIR